MIPSRDSRTVRDPRARRVLARLRVALIGLTIAAAAGLALPPSRAPVLAAEPNQVTIDNFTFAPATLAVPAGTTVTWTNRDDIPHTVREKNSGFKSSTLDTGDRYSYTFTTPGEYSYFCSLHPHMTGKVIVQAN